MTDVIKGTYADLKHIKTRGMWQVCIEVPEAEFNNIVGLLGSPQHGKDVWVAIARLTTEAAQEKPRKRFDEMSRAQQAGILCADEQFQQWVLGQCRNYILRTSLEMENYVTNWLYTKLEISSRKDLDTGPTIAALWDALVTEYRQATGQIAEAR